MVRKSSCATLDPTFTGRTEKVLKLFFDSNVSNSKICTCFKECFKASSKSRYIKFLVSLRYYTPPQSTCKPLPLFRKVWTHPIPGVGVGAICTTPLTEQFDRRINEAQSPDFCSFFMILGIIWAVCFDTSLYPRKLISLRKISSMYLLSSVVRDFLMMPSSELITNTTQTRFS